MSNPKTQAKPAETKTPADALEAKVKTPVKKGREFTYIGAGANSPYVITLMGKQEFVRGKLTEVTDPEILAKIDGISTFIEGEVDAEVLHKIDQEGKAAYDAQIAQDQAINARFNKKHRGE